ncbi:MAG: hypothetical protein ACLT3D_10105 [Lawsonibacter sp.]
MADAVKDRPCGMAAVLNLDRDTLKQICEDASDAGGGGRAPTSTAPVRSSSPATPTRWTGPGAGQEPREPNGCCPSRSAAPSTPPHGPRRRRLWREKFRSVLFREMEIPVLFNCLGDLNGGA